MIQPKLWLIEQQLQAKSPKRRLRAVRRLRKVEDGSVVGLLGQALTDDDPAVRCEAAMALGDELDDRGVPALVRALNDSDEAVQEMVIRSLKQIGDSAAVDALVVSLFNGSPTVSWRAAQALRVLRWQPTTVDEQIQWAVANGEVSVLPGFGEAAVRPLAGMLAVAPYEQRVAIVRALAAIRDPAVQEPLLEALQDENAAVRTAAAEVLTHGSDAPTVSALIGALRDNEHNVREAAAVTLGKIGNPLAVEPLIRLLGDQSWEVRVAVTEALGQLGDARAFPSVMSRMQDRDEAVRQSAIEAVGNVGDDSILEKLVLNLVDDNARVRGAAERSLRKLCPDWENSDRVKRMLPEIQAELKNRGTYTQFAAAGLLRRVGGPGAANRAVAAIVQPSPVITIGQKPSGSPAFLRELMGDADNALRFGAEQAATASGQAVNPVTPLPAAERPGLAEVVIFSATGEVWHEWPAGAARQWWRAVQLVAQHGRRLASGISLGEFDRLQLEGATQRVVMKVSENGFAFVRTAVPGAVAGPADLPGTQNFRPVEMAEGVKEDITRWLRSSASTRGILLRGVRFADKTFVCDVNSQLYPLAELERLYGYVVEVFQTMKPLSPLQLTWLFSRTAIHFARRPDGALLGAFTPVKLADEARAGLAERLKEFRRF